jgi:hypothetical protein
LAGDKFNIKVQKIMKQLPGESEHMVRLALVQLAVQEHKKINKNKAASVLPTPQIQPTIIAQGNKSTMSFF